MDAKFRNNTVMDKTTCREFMKLTWAKNAGILRYVMFGLGVIAIGYGVFQLVMLGSAMLAYAIGMMLLGGVAFFLGNWGYLVRMGRYVKQQQQVWRGPTLEKDVAFYGDNFEQKSKLGRLVFEYDRVTGIKTGKTVFIIFMGNEALLLSKNGFIDSTFEDFKMFFGKKTGVKTGKK